MDLKHFSVHAPGIHCPLVSNNLPAGWLRSAIPGRDHGIGGPGFEGNSCVDGFEGDQTQKAQTEKSRGSGGRDFHLQWIFCFLWASF